MLWTKYDQVSDLSRLANRACSAGVRSPPSGFPGLTAPAALRRRVKPRNKHRRGKDRGTQPLPPYPGGRNARGGWGGCGAVFAPPPDKRESDRDGPPPMTMITAPSQISKTSGL